MKTKTNFNFALNCKDQLNIYGCNDLELGQGQYASLRGEELWRMLAAFS
jgi:hypothetical protein